jgi:hypothetical protein
MEVPYICPSIRSSIEHVTRIGSHYLSFIGTTFSQVMASTASQGRATLSLVLPIFVLLVLAVSGRRLLHGICLIEDTVQRLAGRPWPIKKTSGTIHLALDRVEAQNRCATWRSSTIYPQPSPAIRYKNVRGPALNTAKCYKQDPSFEYPQPKLPSLMFLLRNKYTRSVDLLRRRIGLSLFT